MQWARIEAKISSKVEREETAPTGPQSLHGREGGKFNKEKTIKMNLMHEHFMQSHTSHSIHTLHQIYVFLSETRIQSEKGSCTR